MDISVQKEGEIEWWKKAMRYRVENWWFCVHIFADNFTFRILSKPFFNVGPSPWSTFLYSSLFTSTHWFSHNWITNYNWNFIERFYSLLRSRSFSVFYTSIQATRFHLWDYIDKVGGTFRSSHYSYANRVLMSWSWERKYERPLNQSDPHSY